MFGFVKGWGQNLGATSTPSGSHMGAVRNLPPHRAVVFSAMLGPLAPRTRRMLRLTDNLRADHAVTAVGLAALTAVSEHVRRGGAFPADDCAVLLRFVREFVLAVHMRKEAELVCPAVAMRGDDRAAATVGELFRLHEE